MCVLWVLCCLFPEVSSSTFKNCLLPESYASEQVQRNSVLLQLEINMEETRTRAEEIVESLERDHQRRLEEAGASAEQRVVFFATVAEDQFAEMTQQFSNQAQHAAIMS